MMGPKKKRVGGIAKKAGGGMMAKKKRVGGIAKKRGGGMMKEPTAMKRGGKVKKGKKKSVKKKK